MTLEPKFLLLEVTATGKTKADMGDTARDSQQNLRRRTIHEVQAEVLIGRSQTGLAENANALRVPPRWQLARD